MTRGMRLSPASSLQNLDQVGMVVADGSSFGSRSWSHPTKPARQSQRRLMKAADGFGLQERREVSLGDILRVCNSPLPGDDDARKQAINKPLVPTDGRSATWPRRRTAVESRLRQTEGGVSGVAEQ